MKNWYELMIEFDPNETGKFREGMRRMLERGGRRKSDKCLAVLRVVKEAVLIMALIIWLFSGGDPSALISL